MNRNSTIDDADKNKYEGDEVGQGGSMHKSSDDARIQLGI